MESKNKTIGAGEFKTHCLKLIDEVNQTKQSITITKHGQAMAELIPIKEETYSLFGCLENTVEITGDIVEGTGEIWEVDV
jgi:prevent-host-death family protein